MKRFAQILGLAGGAAWLLAACATRPPARTAEADVNPDALAHYAAGISHELNEQSDDAFQDFYQAALADPSNEGLSMELARRLLTRKQNQEAIDVLAKSAAQPHASGEIQVWLARALLQSGRTNEAIRAVRQAVPRVEGEPLIAPAAAELLFNAGQPGEALRVGDRLERSQKAPASGLIDLADLVMVRSADGANRTSSAGLAAALRLLNRAAQLETNSARLRQRLGDEYIKAGEPARAAAVYEKLAADTSRDSTALDVLREKLANAYLALNNRAAATNQLRLLLQDNPGRYPEVWFDLGTLDYDGHDFTNAAADFGQALRLNPELEQGYYNLALARVDLQDTNGSLEIMRRARDKFPNSFGSVFFTGIIQARLKQFGDALKSYSAAESLAQKGPTNRLDARFYFEFGAASERAHELEKAAGCFQKCLALQPDFHEAMNYLGYMWADQGEHLDEARLLIEKAVKLEPKNPAYLDSLGWVLFKLNQPRQALPHVLKALQLSGAPDATILDHLGDIYRQLGQAAKAREAWRKSLALEANDAIKKKLDEIPGNS